MTNIFFGSSESDPNDKSAAKPPWTAIEGIDDNSARVRGGRENEDDTKARVAHGKRA